MTTQPPYQINVGFAAGRFQLVPQALWNMFCDRATATAMLEKAKACSPEAVLCDVLRDKTLPLGVSRLPVPWECTDPTTDISVYVIAGTVSLKGEGPDTAALQEFAGWLSDTQQGAYDNLDIQAQNIQGHVGKSRLFAYVSPYDPQDSDLYWADEPALGGLAA